MPMSARLRIAALVLMPVLLCLSASARAEATYKFSLSGEAKQAGSSWAWTGTLAIVLDTGADGLFDSSHILSFDMNSSVSTFDWPDGGPIPFIVYVYVADGQMTSVSGVHYGALDPDETMDFTGLSVHYDQPPIAKLAETVADAILIPIAIPEPGAWQMSLLGLGLVTAGCGVRRRATPPQRPASH